MEKERIEKREGVVKNQMGLIFNPHTIRIFSLFDNSDSHNHKGEYINNIAGIAGDTGMGHKTTRKYLTPMVEMGILRELVVGKSGKVFMLDENSDIAKALIALRNALDENKIENLIRDRNNK